MGVSSRGMNSKVGMHLCGNRCCADESDNDDDSRDYYHKRNHHAPVTETVYEPMSISETHWLCLQNTITNCVSGLCHNVWSYMLIFFQYSRQNIIGGLSKISLQISCQIQKKKKLFTSILFFSG